MVLFVVALGTSYKPHTCARARASSREWMCVHTYDLFRNESTCICLKHYGVYIAIASIRGCKRNGERQKYSVYVQGKIARDKERCSTLADTYYRTCWSVRDLQDTLGLSANSLESWRKKGAKGRSQKKKEELGNDRWMLVPKLTQGDALAIGEETPRAPSSGR